VLPPKMLLLLLLRPLFNLPWKSPLPLPRRQQRRPLLANRVLTSVTTPR